jgi:CBS domain-containing protein
MTLSIRDAASLMTQHKCSSILLKSSDGKYVGIVTDNDLRRRVIAKGVDTQRPVSDVMSSPLQTTSSNSQVFETLMIMMQDDVKHLGVRDADDAIVGIISNRDLLLAQGQSPFFLIRELNAASSLDEIVEKNSKLTQMVQSLINTGAKAKNITKFITSVSEVVLNKLISFALESLGPPPARFVFMILGSEGRKEQTLKTDQDNAIVFEDVPEERLPEVNAYFLKFGEKVCTDQDKAGYAFCTGGIMAKNPKWCQPLSVWKDYFSTWIYTAEAEDLLQSSIFFDFRGGYGDMTLIDSLRKFLMDSLEGWQGFFRHLTENALHFRPPLGFFRSFVVESKGEHRNAFDIKSAMMPIVDFARVYALHHRIEETNTMERLHQLYIKQVLSWNDYNELEQAYGFLMQLRFVRQVTAVIEEKNPPNNYVNPKKLTNIEQKMLKEIFRKTEKFQDKMNFDFIGIF